MGTPDVQTIEGRRTVRRVDPFDCRTLCAGAADGRWNAARRAHMQCTRLDFRGAWRPPRPTEAVRLGQWLGLAHADGSRRTEDPADGCPGGWARSRFAESFLRYRRRRLAGGAHDTNPRVYHGTPPLVLEALGYYEGCEAHAAAEFDSEVNKR